MLTNRTLKAVLVATLKSKAFWRLAATLALMAGLTIPNGLFELLAELATEVLEGLDTG